MLKYMFSAFLTSNIASLFRLEDIKEKYEAEVKNHMNTQALLKETAASNLQMKVRCSMVIPSTASKIGIVDGKIKLPLKGFS